MSNEDDVVVTIDEAGQPVVEKTDEGKQAPDPAAAELSSQLEELRASEAAAKAEKAAAEAQAAAARREADLARTEAKSARNETADSQLETVTMGIEAARAEANAAEQAVATFMEAGNFAEVAKAQRRLANAEAKIVRLEEAKDFIASRKAAAPVERTGDDGQQQRQPPADPFEAYLANRTKPTADWLRAHKDWVVDPKKNARLTSAHWAAVADGLVADTPEYFEAVERTIGLRQAPPSNGANGNGAAPKRNGSPPVAPVSSTGGGTNGGGNEVRLSKLEVNSATDGTIVWNYDDPSGQKRFKKGDPIGVQEFARRKKAMAEQGLYDKTYVEQ